ncbi:MAG: hypothetical protein JKY96_05245 [Phycisphaerales bacterium]|nr:hypothetical protein [Phycisphaerales bacterium]
MTIRLGDILVQHGALTNDQRDAIVAQQGLIERPFGVLAEEMFGVSPADVEHAWAVQYAMFSQTVDPQRHVIDPRVLGKVESRQAWQFGLIPMYTKEGETVFATSTEYLARALRFVGWRFDGACSFSICTIDDLVGGLRMHYAMEAMTEEMVVQLMRRSRAA